MLMKAVTVGGGGADIGRCTLEHEVNVTTIIATIYDKNDTQVAQNSISASSFGGVFNGSVSGTINGDTYVFDVSSNAYTNTAYTFAIQKNGTTIDGGTKNTYTGNMTLAYSTEIFFRY